MTYRLLLIEQSDTSVQWGEPHGHCKKEKCCICCFYRLLSKYFRRPLHSHGCTVCTVPKKRDVIVLIFFFFTKLHQKYGIVMRLWTQLKWVLSAPFAFYLKAFLHLAIDVTLACEHRQTRIWNVLWRNPISGFNGSSEAAHPGSCEICARVKACLFNQCSYFQLLTLLLCMPLFSAQKTHSTNLWSIKTIMVATC